MDPRRRQDWATYVDLEARLPWLTAEPYLLDVADLAATRAALDELGFRTVTAKAPAAGDLERSLLVELTERLGFTALGAGSWAAFSDRLWDLVTESWDPPIAVVIEGFSRLMEVDLRTFVRCVHNLVSLTECVGLADDRAQRQFVYFFVGEGSAWG
ncbi:MAG TPA: hypothetical protein VFH76_05435 [Kribbella sp.]|nr:hypothetical protein [Kribbella sp.]